MTKSQTPVQPGREQERIQFEKGWQAHLGVEAVQEALGHLEKVSGPQIIAGRDLGGVATTVSAARRCLDQALELFDSARTYRHSTHGSPGRQRCVKCGHNNIDSGPEGGTCEELMLGPTPLAGMVYCGCKCELPDAAPVPESEVSEADLAALDERINTNIGRMEESQKMSQSDLANIEFSAPVVDAGTEARLPQNKVQAKLQNSAEYQAAHEIWAWTFERGYPVNDDHLEWLTTVITKHVRTTPAPSIDVEREAREVASLLADMRRKYLEARNAGNDADWLKGQPITAEILERWIPTVEHIASALSARSSQADNEGDRK